MTPTRRLAIANLTTAMLLLASPLSHAATPEQLAGWGGEVLQQIEREHHDDGRRYYRDKRREDQPVFMWGAGVQFTALTAAAQWDPPRYTPEVKRFADPLQDYWVEHNGIGGYDVQPSPTRPDRYYDDNAWVVLALVEAFEVTGERVYLERAKSTLRFVMSGEDQTLGGGIYWRENHRSTKNTCVNAPAIVCLLRVHQFTNDPQLLADAERLYAWTRENLRDPADGLYWDNVRRSWRDGSTRVDRRKYSYNSALMIRAHCLLHQALDAPEHLEHARQLAAAAVKRWVDPETGAVRDSGRFAHLLLGALLELDTLTDEANYRPTVVASLEYLHNQLRDQQGRYPTRWDASPAARHGNRELIDQASAARAFYEGALRLNST